MKVQQKFKSVFTYAAGVEVWCNDYYNAITGGKKLTYTFPADFAIADWYGEKDVRETYNRVKKSWLESVEAWTEVVISLNILSWCNDQLIKQGIEDRERWIKLYSELYYQAKEDFYNKYSNDEKALDYFFEMTD
jgi:hypothetical protein